ncbi:MAG: hypothetical protein LBJ20_06370 [Candidatus Methanoplasma sp.]|jgi:hypothetical protein|nr:hypothetical protein [Candidatus Methanoplasma sp.]
MRKFGVRSARPVSDGGFLPASDDGQGVWFKREWRLITLLAIMVVAFVMRFVFAYGVSAGSDFALSGGSGASIHVHIIENILGGSFTFTDPALNYPYGSVNVYPPLMDIILSGVAGIVSMFGISAGTAAAGTLAFSAPIFAALTCWPVYLIGRKMFSDEKIGLLAALLYAFFALMVMTTSFSNGTEYAFVGFLFSFMLYFLLKALDCCDKTQPDGFRAMIGDRTLLKNALAAGILFAMIALSWNQFRVILLMLVFFMAAQAVIDRLRSKEMIPTVGVYSLVILVGVLISAPYYLAAGLWVQIFSGPFILAFLSVALTVFLSKTAGRSWVLMIPVTLIIAAIVLAVLFFASGELFSAVVNGNSVYTGGQMSGLVSGASRTSISSMASFFGWVTVWLPLVMFLYMLYKYRGNMDSRKYTFTMLWILAMFCIGWYSTSYAAIAGMGFAVASAAVILMVIRRVDLRGYFADMRGNGIKYALRKALKPIPLAVTIAIVALVAVPNAVYAVDAGIPTNSEGDGYFGGLGYTIITNDVNSVDKMWDYYNGIEKDGALLAWLNYSVNSASNGGFDSVTDPYGGGASALSAAILATSSSVATAAMAIRLVLADGLASFESAIRAAGLDYSKIKGYTDDPSTAVTEVKNNVALYPGVSPSITEENALYAVLIRYITATISEQSINSLYDSICGTSGKSIKYVLADRSMLPLYYGDGTYFSSVAYLGSKNMDGYGAPNYYYTYGVESGYAAYTDAMYDTFFWKSLIGMSPAEAGYTSSTTYLNALALSDGSVKANPGYGLSDYKIAYWHVYYNPDSKADGSSDGWEDMDAFEAMKRQSEDGGLVNYVNGVVLMEYDSTMTEEVSGTVSYVSPNGAKGAGGIQVSVFVKTDYDTSGIAGYVKKSTVFTKANGSYDVSVPVSGEYYVVFSSGTDTIVTGSVIDTRWNMISADSRLDIPVTNLSGSVVVGTDPYTEDCYVGMTGKASGEKYETKVSNGIFVFGNVIPDIYEVTVYSPSGTTINTASVTANAGPNAGFQMSATSGKITVTATDDVGANAKTGTIVARDTLTGAEFRASVAGATDGKIEMSVVPSTYVIYAADGKVSVSNPSVTVSSNGSKSASLTLYDSRSISVTGAPSGSLITLMSYGFVTSSSSASLAVPTINGSAGIGEKYTAYAVSGNMVYYGVSAGSSVSLAGAAGYSVKGVSEDSAGEKVSATVSFIGDGGATFIFTSGEDGKFDVRLPAGTYTMYLFGSSSSSISTVTVSGDTDLGNISMSKSRDITITVSYRTNMSSSSTRGIAFADVNMSISVGNTEYSITVKTNSDGKAIFTVPEGNKAVMSISGFDTARFHMEERSTDISAGTGDTSYTWSIAANESDDSDSYVKTVSVSNGVPVSITLYNSSSTTYNVSGLTSVIPGQYTAVIKGSTGYYYSGTVYVYPGHSGSLNIEVTNVVRVELNASATDEITVTPTDEEAGGYFVDSDNPLVYYLERGKGFYFKAVSGAGEGTERIAYASVASATGPVTLNLSDKADKAIVKGYLGVTANGELRVTYGNVTIPFTVTDGIFEITVPAGKAMQLSASLGKTVNGTEYRYTGTASMSEAEVTDGASIHFPATTSSSQSGLDLSGSGFSFSNGRGSFILTVKNTGDFGVTYIVKAGSAWILDKEYTLTVGAKSSGTVTVSGSYDAENIGAGNENLSVTVTSLNGSSVGTYVLDGSAMSPIRTTDTYVDVSGTEDAFVDAVSGYEYMYAVTITNHDNYLKTVSISALISGGSGKWSVVYSDKGEGNISSAAGANSYKVSGYGSTVIYIKLMCRDATDTSVPVVNVTVTAQGQNLSTNSSGVSIVGNNATFSMNAQPAEMESEDMSASGSNVYDDSGSMPASSAALIALCILALIAMAWFGMKKGVFVRRK